MSIVKTIVTVDGDKEVNLDKRKLETKLKTIKMRIGREVRTGGMMIARNMPNNATDKAETILAGRMLPIRMPSAVPSAQQGAAKLIAP